MKKKKLTTINKAVPLWNTQPIYFDLGGKLATVGAAAADQVASGIGRLNEVNDRANMVEQETINSVTNPTPAASTTDLLNSWASWNPTAHISYKDLLNGSTVGDMLSGAGNGALAGSAFGGMYTGIGAAAGLITRGLFGWAAKREAKKKARKINNMIDAQNLSTQRAFSNQAEQLDDEMVANELSDFTGWEAAYGGPLFANGGRIHIDPKNRGKFTETKRRTGKTTEELTHSSNPLTRKRAIFAQNARKWKHAFGGDLMTHGADFPTGLILIGNGGTHEENPLEGVPMGMDSEGIPNLVEEGEVIFNDYVFSKRLKVPKAVRKKYRLGGAKSLTFADAAIQMSKESEERPNDPISQRGLEDWMLKLMVAQEQLRAKKGKTNTFANGGLVRKYGDAGPLPMITRDPNNPFTLPEDILRLRQLPPVIDPKRSALSVIAERKSADAPIIQDADGNLYKMQYDYSTSDPLNISAKRTEVKLPENTEDSEVKDTVTKPEKTTTGSKSMDLLRFAPAFSQGLQTLTDALGLTNRPDFALGKKIREANRQVRGIGTRAAGQRIGYKPTDEWAAINNFNAQMAAQRSALRNSGNRVGAAGQLLASAYNQNRALGELYAGMEKENWNRLTQAITHNTSIDQANRNAELQAAQADAAQGNIRAQNLITAAKADDAEETAYAQARATNKDNFFNTLGTIGKERIDRNMMRGLIESGVFGTPNQSMLEALGYLGINPTKKAKGGKLKKRGLTY